MAWDSKTNATQLTSINATEQFFSTKPTLQPNQAAHCQVTIDFPTTPADDATVSVYATLDDTTYDTTPYMTMRVSKATDNNIVSFIVQGVYQFRVGVKGTSGMTITDADMSYRIASV